MDSAAPPSDPFAALLSPSQGGMSVPAPVNYTHDALIDEIIRDPRAGRAELARRFGRSYNWLTQIMSSNLFQAKLAARKEEILDPVLVATVEERLEAVARTAMDVLLEAQLTPDQAIKALAEAVKGLGMGGTKGPAVVQNFVAVVPAKAQSFDEWMADHGPAGGGLASGGRSLVGGLASGALGGGSASGALVSSAPPLKERAGVEFAEVVAGNGET